MARMRSIVALVLVLGACDSAADAADKSGKKAGELADQAGDKAKTLADDAVDAGKQTAADAIDQGKNKAKGLWDDLPSTGQLSASASAWLDGKSEGSIEHAIAKGKQIAPVALEIGKTVHGAVDESSAIEPIFQKVDEGGRTPAQVDAAIADMPRKEVVDGVTVGLKQLDELSAERTVKERGYLVMWRKDDHLIGFVYRSRREIDLETLAKETPRLVELVQSAVGE